LEFRARSRALDKTGLDLAMAVAAEQDTLLGFAAVGSQRLSRRHRHREELCRRVDVVEVKADDAAVVSAESTYAACLLDQNASHCLMPSGHRFGDAALAAPARSALTVGVPGELGRAVPRAVLRLNRA
jgi:hypothetical protein